MTGCDPAAAGGDEEAPAYTGIPTFSIQSVVADGSVTVLTNNFPPNQTFTVRMGDTICVHAELLRVGNSSMDIKLEVWARQLVGAYEAERQLVTEGLFRYVAVDENRKPRRVPDNPLFFTRD